MKGPDTLTEKLDRILSDPAIAALGQQNASDTQAGEAAAAATGQTGDIPTASGGATDVSGIGRLLSNPEMIAKLPQILALLKPMLQKATDKTGESAVPAGAKPRNNPPDGRIALLLALKPYLSPSRCESIDTIVTFCKLNDLLSGLL